MAAGVGFEPTKPESESGGLPLAYPAMAGEAGYDPAIVESKSAGLPISLLPNICLIFIQIGNLWAGRYRRLLPPHASSLIV